MRENTITAPDQAGLDDRSNIRTMMTWEQSVEYLRNSPALSELVRACYFDDPLIGAAQRFWKSPEWTECRKLLASNPGSVADIGAGRGISSFAFAKDGWCVTAIEPDPSDLVGAGAIRRLMEEAELDIAICSATSECLPFETDTFDVVNCRQSLHHARDLEMTCQELYRVLKPGGVLLATREHVISKPEDLAEFLKYHALHKFYGGENAYMLSQYLTALSGAGFKLRNVIGPFESAINFFPKSEEEVLELSLQGLAKRIGKRMARLIMSKKTALGRYLTKRSLRRLSKRDSTPGRLYSFVAIKPGSGKENSSNHSQANPGG